MLKKMMNHTCAELPRGHTGVRWLIDIDFIFCLRSHVSWRFRY